VHRDQIDSVRVTTQNSLQPCRDSGRGMADPHWRPARSTTPRRPKRCKSSSARYHPTSPTLGSLPEQGAGPQGTELAHQMIAERGTDGARLAFSDAGA
jgi:hypothetical protein